MEGYPFVFYHPQYGGLRVVDTDYGLFFCIDDLVAITGIGRDKLFTVLADTEGNVFEFHVVEDIKKVPKKLESRLFFAEAFGDGEKVVRKNRKAQRDMIFIDSQVVRDMTVGISDDSECKLFYKWVKNFIQPMMKEDRLCSHECLLMVDAYCDPYEKPMDIRYAADGLYINGMRIN